MQGQNNAYLAGPFYACCGIRHPGTYDIAVVKDMDMRTYADLVAALISFQNR